MEEGRTTLAAEVAAELELSVPAAAEALARKLRSSERLGRKLRELGLVRTFAVSEHDASRLDIAGVAGAGETLPAFGGLLYGTSVHAHRLQMEERRVLDASEEVRVHVGDLDYYESGQRVRWKLRQHMYELLGQLVEAEAAPQVILQDLPILVSRGEEANREEIEEVQEEWLELVDTINSFWRMHLDRTFPIDPQGVLIASVRQQSALPLFVALHNNPETSADEVRPELGQMVRQEWKQLRQAGVARLLDQLMTARTRTIAYAYEDLNLDPRWQPYELHHSGILGFYLRTGARTPIWQVQAIGHRTQWTSEQIDRLAALIARATITEHEDAEPLPLWYARRLVRFPRPILILFRDLTRERVYHADRAAESEP